MRKVPDRVQRADYFKCVHYNDWDCLPVLDQAKLLKMNAIEPKMKLITKILRKKEVRREYKKKWRNGASAKIMIQNRNAEKSHAFRYFRREVGAASLLLKWPRQEILGLVSYLSVSTSSASGRLTLSCLRIILGGHGKTAPVGPPHSDL